MLAKLVNGSISYAPKSIYVKGNLVENPSEGLLTSLGYLPVIENDMPDEPVEGMLYVCDWVETSNGIEQVYTLVSEPKKTMQELALELTEKQMNNIDITDNESLYYAELYPEYSDLCNANNGNGFIAEKPGFKFKYSMLDNVKLYKTIQPNFTFQSQWTPGEGTSAIFTQIVVGQAGTLEDPIDVPADVATNAFTYIIGKYYRWNGVIYKCTRPGEEDGKEHSFVYSPDQLVGQYFEVVE